MKKFTQLRTLLTMLLMFVGLGAWSQNVVYTLDTSKEVAKGSNSAYASDCDVTVDGITWNVTGNATMQPWRLGGKSLSKEDRVVYTKTATSEDIDVVRLTIGDANATINSIKLAYSTNSDFSGATTINASGTAAKTSYDFAPEGGFKSGTYFQFIINVTVTTTSNKYVHFSKVEFISNDDDTPDADPVAVESVSLTDAEGNAMGMYQGLVQGESLQLKAVVAPNNATNKKVTWDVLQDTEVISLENGLVKALAPGRAAVTVTTEDGEYQAAVTFVVTEPQPSTIEDFIANEGGTCYLTGIVSNIANATYGNFDLTDETGTIYVYGCLTPEGEAKKFAELGIEEGNKITVLASTYKLYNDKNKGDIDEAVNVVFVENYGTPATYTFNIVPGAETFTVTPSDNDVQYYIQIADAEIMNELKAMLSVDDDVEALTTYLDMTFADMGEGLDYFSGVQTQSYEDDWYIDEPGKYFIVICAVDENYERCSDVKIVEFTLEAPTAPVEVTLSNIEIMNLTHPQLGIPVSWWNAQDEEGNNYMFIFDENYNFLDASLALATGEDLSVDQSYDNTITANSTSLDATIKFTDYDEIEQVYHITAKIAVAEMAITDALYSTFCAPFEVEVPYGVTAYTIDAVENNVLTMTEVTSTIPANTPVVLYAEGAGSITVTGTAVEGTPKAGLLTGVYEETKAPAGSYVLQNQDAGVGFYQVVAGQEPTVGINRAYLTVDSSIKAFSLSDATAIKAIEALMAGKAEIYDLNGRKMQSLQKGMNIVNGKKVMVK